MTSICHPLPLTVLPHTCTIALSNYMDLFVGLHIHFFCLDCESGTLGVKSFLLESDPPKWDSWICLLLAVGLWGSCLPSLCLGFRNYKM